MGIVMMEASVDNVMEGVAMESFGKWVVMGVLKEERGYLWSMGKDYLWEVCVVGGEE